MPSSTTPTSSSVAVRAKDKVESPGSYTMGDFTPDSSQGPATPSRPRSEKEVQLDYRRTRGEISCAECRRQKLKCDKKIPCSSCVRRGCQSVCPTGTLPSKTPSSAKADSKLCKKLLQMSKRIRQLEDALKILQTRVSSAPHPLLTKDLLEIKTVSHSDDSEDSPDSADADIYDDFGTLTITEKGLTHFVGRSGAEAIIATAFDGSSEKVKKKAYAMLPPEITHLTCSFPFSPVHDPKDKILATLESHLPSYDRATALVEAYLQHISFFFRPVKREQIMEELLPKFYQRRGDAGAERTPVARGAVHSPSSAATRVTRDGSPDIVEHQLALLLAVFACGAAGDLTLDACNEEGETYRQLARSALSLHSVFEGTSLATVQAVALIGAYDFHSASAQTIESAFKLLSLAHCLGVTIGLHWDPERWNIEQKLIQRRRNLFWELYAMDVCKSMGSGRPLMLHLDEINCKFPDDDDVVINVDGSVSQGFWRWKTEYATKVAQIVVRKMCTARPMKYSDILELDRKVREHPDITSPSPALGAPYSTNSMQHLIKVLHSEAVLFFIHRNFFIMALRENPGDPLRSRFASSFLATYSSAISILRAFQKEFAWSNYLLLRQWTLWVLALGCGVVVGSIAATNTLSELSQTALGELHLVINLFEKALTHPVAKNGLPILRRLRDKAQSNMEAAGQADNSASSSPTVKTEEVDEALLMIGGTSRVIQHRRPYERAVAEPQMNPPDPSFAPIYDPETFLPSSRREDQTVNVVPNGMSTEHLEADRGISYALEAQYSSSGWDQQMPPDDRFYHASDGSAAQVSNDLSPFSSGEASQPDVREPSMFSMNMNVDNFEFHIRGMQPNFVPVVSSNARTGNVDVMIEDAWRTILEDPRLTNTGLNEPSYLY